MKFPQRVIFRQLSYMVPLGAGIFTASYGIIEYRQVSFHISSAYNRDII